jgi:hypothetical protein
MSNKASLYKILSNSDAVREYRKEALRDEIKMPDGIWIVDTVYAPDTEEIETGIKNENWIIVEQYGQDWQAAKAGHEKWCNAVKSGQKKFTGVLEYEL